MDEAHTGDLGSEARKPAVLDSVLDCIITMDSDGMVIEFNAAAERTFGYTKAEAIGRALADLIIPPPLRDAHAAGLARDAATTGRVIGTSTIARDITSRKKAEAELTRLTDEIQLQRPRVFKATMRTVQDYRQ